MLEQHSKTAEGLIGVLRASDSHRASLHQGRKSAEEKIQVSRWHPTPTPTRSTSFDSPSHRHVWQGAPGRACARTSTTRELARARARAPTRSERRLAAARHLAHPRRARTQNARRREATKSRTSRAASSDCRSMPSTRPPSSARASSACAVSPTCTVRASATPLAPRRLRRPPLGRPPPVACMV